jgi:XTP/dITP diphosphohydrolase
MNSFSIVIATRNMGKLREIQMLFSDFPVIWRTMDELGDPPVVEETGETFLENALLKARAIHAWCGCSVLAEDSGLVVDALSGAPGVRSARFAGEHSSDAENVALLLNRLSATPFEQRTAHFTAVAAFAGDDGAEHHAEGCCFGHIASAASGSSGFGYDPVFVPEGQSSTFAELGEEFKNRVSHRAVALRKLRDPLSLWLQNHAIQKP